MKMIQNSIVNNNFPPGVTKGFITLLHKGGKKKQLFNQRPIAFVQCYIQDFCECTLDADATSANVSH
jgi:hypothetical protein